MDAFEAHQVVPYRPLYVPKRRANPARSEWQTLAAFLRRPGSTLTSCATSTPERAMALVNHTIKRYLHRFAIPCKQRGHSPVKCNRRLPLPSALFDFAQKPGALSHTRKMCSPERAHRFHHGSKRLADLWIELDWVPLTKLGCAGLSFPHHPRVPRAVRAYAFKRREDPSELEPSWQGN